MIVNVNENEINKKDAKVFSKIGKLIKIVVGYLLIYIIG